MLDMFALLAVHPRDWSHMNSLVEAVPRAFWKLLQNRSDAAAYGQFLGLVWVLDAVVEWRDGQPAMKPRDDSLK